MDHTETCFDNLDPNWEHCFNVIFNFGQTLHLRFEVFDKDPKGANELIGFHETTLADIVKQSTVIGRHLQGPH